MDEYRVEFYKNGEKIGTEEVPKEYLNGMIVACREEIIRKEQEEGLWKRIVE